MKMIYYMLLVNKKFKKLENGLGPNLSFMKSMLTNNRNNNLKHVEQN